MTFSGDGETRCPNLPIGRWGRQVRGRRKKEEGRPRGRRFFARAIFGRAKKVRPGFGAGGPAKRLKLNISD